MQDITVIILTFNEEIHIERCITNVLPLAKDIYVVDSFSNDKTVDIAKHLGANVIQHAWPGNQAEQFNWALDNIKINTKWILRLDADEYLLPELIEEMEQKIPTLQDNITGVVLNRRHIFMGQWMKRGIYPVKLLRLFRTGKGRSEHRLMDEHIELTEGNSIEFDNDFCDDNLNNLSWFCHKHVNYAIREAAELLDAEYNLSETTDKTPDIHIASQAQRKRNLKQKYAQLPLFWRAFAYFLYRYFVKGACLDGKVGFIWTFLQGFWYRILVDAEIFEIKRKCGNDKSKIIKLLQNDYSIKF